jgi:hypothetical protein
MNVGRNQIPERKSIDGVKMKKILSLSLDKNEVDRIASVMEMKLYHKWELNETGGLDLYIEDWFSSQEDVYRGSSL